MEETDLNGGFTFLRRTAGESPFEVLTLEGTPPALKGARVAKRPVAPPVRPRAVSYTGGPSGEVIILGAGIAGLTVAYDLLRNHPGQFKVKILEATNRVGGRSLTLRDGNQFTEIVDLGGERPVPVTQTMHLRSEPGQTYPPYLNAGPGRIPSGHRHVLDLCKALNVDLEVYIMESRSNLVYSNKGQAPLKDKSLVNRRVANDMRGHLAADLYARLPKTTPEMPKAEAEKWENYRNFLISFGALVQSGPKKGTYAGSSRSGYRRLPGLDAGIIYEPIPVDQLLETQFWLTNFYQPDEFLWQSTSFQPVGGMDMIEKALYEQVRLLGAEVLLNAEVVFVKKSGAQWKVQYRDQTGLLKDLTGNYCVSNIPIPLLHGKLDRRDFSPAFWRDLDRVITAPGFLEPTCKVGWQAERRLWQDPKAPNDIPIYGGISRTTNPMVQMWYPSDRFHDKFGVLTGAYNYTSNAEAWGKLMPKDRLALARQGAEQLHGKEFAEGLKDEYAVSIAWQNIPTQRGGWADWSKVSDDPVEQSEIMNTVREGENNFLIVGDQVSHLPGWKEGAVVTAMDVYALISQVAGYKRMRIAQVPNTAALTQGYHV